MNTPAYARVFSDLSQKIKDGTYPVGALLPSEPELEKIYSVSRTTIRKAVSMLTADRWVRVKQGYGTEVLPRPKLPPEGKFRFHGSPTITEHLPLGGLVTTPMSVDMVPVPAAATEFLRLKPDESVYRVQRLLTASDTGEAAAYRINYLSPRSFPDFERFDRMQLSLYTLLYNQYGVSFSDGYETVTAVAADFITARILNTPVGAPLLFMQRYANANKGQLEYAELYIVPKYYELRVHMTGSPVRTDDLVDSGADASV